MDITSWLIACIPILSFGFLPVVATRIGGRPVDQTMGVALGSIVFAVIVYGIKRPELNEHIFIIGLFSGLCWAVGSVGQFMGLTYLGVSRSMPISCGTQIVFTSLMGVGLGDWASNASKGYGFSALALIIVGIVFTSYESNETKREAQTIGANQWAKGIAVNVLSSLGFTAYVAILKYYRISGWESLLPQSVGQVIGIIVISLLFFRTLPFSQAAGRNALSGLIWAAGNISLLIAQAAIGLAIAYPFSQAAVIVAVLGGVYINGEKKDKKEWRATFAGIAIIIVGLYLIYLSSR